jgi:hypothetical protein
LKGEIELIKLRFLTALIAFCFVMPFSLIAGLDWEVIDEDFEEDFGAFTKVEHTGADRTAEVDNGFAVLNRVGNPADIGPTMRAYFDDPGSGEFIMYAKVDVKSFGEGGHFVLCMRINGFEYFPTISEDKIGDHETLEQWNSGIAEQQVDASPIGVHEYIIVGKSENAYDLYLDGELIIEDGITRSLGGAEWEVAQAMVHVRKGADTEIHVDAVRVKQGNEGLKQIISVELKGKLTLTWGKIKS